MFKLVRHFSAVSAIFMVAASLLPPAIAWFSAKNSLVRGVEADALSLARSMKKTVGLRFTAYLVKTTEVEGQALRAHQETRRIDEVLKTFTNASSFLKVNIYNLNRLRVFSSESDPIGVEIVHPEDIPPLASLEAPASTLMMGATVSTSEGPVKDKDLVTSYIPILDDDIIVGVFELFTDVDARVSAARDTAVTLLIAELIVFGLMFALLYPMIRRAQGTLERQQADGLANEANLETIKSALEQETAEHGLSKARLEERQDLLDSISRAQSRPLDQPAPTGLLETLLLDLLRLSGSEFGFIGELGKDENATPYLHILAISDIARNMHFQDFADLQASPDFRLYEFDAFGGAPPSSGAPVITNDFAPDTPLAGLPEGHPPLNAFLGIPLLRDQRVIGVIGMANGANGYDNELVDHLGPVISTCASLMETHRIWEDVKRTLQKLEEAETDKDVILNSALEGIITIDDGGKVVEMNPSAEAMFGIGAAEALGKQVEEMVIPPELRDSHRRALRQFLDTGKKGILDERIELQAMRTDGHRFPVELIVTHFQHGERQYFTAFIRDLTEHKEAEERLRRNHDDRETIAAIQRLSLAQTSLDEMLKQALSLLLARRTPEPGTTGAVFLMDEKTGQLEMTALQGLAVPLMKTDAELPFDLDLCQRVAESGEIGFTDASGAALHGQYCAPIGGEKAFGVLSLSVAKGFGRTEEEDKFIGAAADVLATAIRRKRTEEALDEANIEYKRLTRENMVNLNQATAAHEQAKRAIRAKSEHLATMGHELSTPLNTIISFAKTILGGALGDIENHRYREYIEYINDAGSQLLDCVGEVLELAEAETDKADINPDDAAALGYYAIYSTSGGKYKDLAEALFQSVIEADPGNAVVLRNYSLFRTTIRNDHERADEAYQLAIEADPGNASLLGNFAVFLSEIRKLPERAEEQYKHAIAAHSKHARNLANYARFLSQVQNDYERADAHYRRALEAEPDNASILCEYALFYWDIGADGERTETLFEDSVKADPNAPLVLREYAAYLIDQGNEERGLRMLQRAISNLQGEDLLRACYLQYAFVKSDDRRTETLKEMRDILESRVRSPNFDRSREVQRLAMSGHPQTDLLKALSRVIAVREPLQSLDRFPAWKDLEKLRSAEKDDRLEDAFKNDENPDGWIEVGGAEDGGAEDDWTEVGGTGGGGSEDGWTQVGGAEGIEAEDDDLIPNPLD